MILYIIIGFQVVFYGEGWNQNILGLWENFLDPNLYSCIFIGIVFTISINRGHHGVHHQLLDTSSWDVSMSKSLHIAVVKLHVAGLCRLGIPTLPTAILHGWLFPWNDQTTGSHRRTTLMFPANPWPFHCDWLSIKNLQEVINVNQRGENHQQRGSLEKWSSLACSVPQSHGQILLLFVCWLVMVAVWQLPI